MLEPVQIRARASGPLGSANVDWRGEWAFGDESSRSVDQLRCLGKCVRHCFVFVGVQSRAAKSSTTIGRKRLASKHTRRRCRTVPVREEDAHRTAKDRLRVGRGSFLVRTPERAGDQYVLVVRCEYGRLIAAHTSRGWSHPPAYRSRG